MKSPFKKLNLKDIGKGFILAFISAFITCIETIATQVIYSGYMELSLAMFKPALLIGSVAGVSYLIKNYFTNSKDQFAKPEPPSDFPNKMF